MRQKLTVTFLLITTLFAAAQETPKESFSFSLEQAIAHALEHNYTVINSGRDIKMAEKKKWETTAMGLPQINGGVDYLNNFDLQKSPLPAEFFGGPSGEFVPGGFGAKHNMTARATLSQLLFDGSYIVALQASKIYLQYFHNLKEKTDNEVTEMVISAYGNVLLAEESIAILSNNKALLEKTLSDTRETYKNGLIEEENVEQLEITQATINSNLNNALRLRDIAYNMLKLTLGVDKSAELTLTDKLVTLTRSNLDMSFFQDSFKIENNIDFKLAQNFKDQRRLELAREKSRALPSLSANFNYGYNSFSNEFNFTSTDWYKFSSLGVSLNVPIFSSGMRSAKTQQAKIAYDQAKTQLTEAEQKLSLQYENARSEFEFSVEEYNTAKNNLSLAERIEHKQQIKFTEGLSSSFDFADAQRQLYSAQQNYLQSMINVINRRAALEKLINAK